MKVSFDFDSTLDNEKIQEYAKELIEQGIDVHVVTSRVPETDPSLELVSSDWNDDMYAICDKLGILKENIHFTKYVDKFKYFRIHQDFLWHMDDDDIEMHLINKFTNTIGLFTYSIYFREEGNKLIEDAKKGL